MTKFLFRKEQELFYNKFIKQENNKREKTKLSKRDDYAYTIDNFYDDKEFNRLTFISSERSKSEVICNSENFSLLERYQVLLSINLSNKKEDIVMIIKEIFRNINYKNINNHIIICEILNIIQNYNLYEFYDNIQNIAKNLNFEGKKNLFLTKEITKLIDFFDKNVGEVINHKKSENKGHPIKKHYVNIYKKSFNDNLINIDEFPGKKNSLNQNLLKKFPSPGLQKLKEKKVQESINSIDFE